VRTTAPTESSVERVRRAELISWNRVELRAASSSAGQSVMVSAALGEGRGRTVEGFGAVEGDLADAGSRTRDEDRGEVGGGGLEADEGMAGWRAGREVRVGEVERTGCRGEVGEGDEAEERSR